MTTSSLVNAPERSVIGKITRSGLDTRRSRPPASTIIASDAAMPGVLRQRRPAHTRRRAAAAHPTLPDSLGSTGSSSPREPDEASASECPRERRQPPRAPLLGATSASGAHAVCGRRGGTPCPARKARATDRGTPLHLVVPTGRLTLGLVDARNQAVAEASCQPAKTSPPRPERPRADNRVRAG